MNTMGNCTISLHTTKDQTIALCLSEPSIASKSIRSGGRCVSLRVVKFLMGLLIVAAATMNLNAVVISPTTTMLAVSPRDPISAGAMVTLTATVTDPGIVSSGFVTFCDATRSTCLPGDGLFGTAQLTRSGTATLRTRFGTGNTSIVAMFMTTKSDLESRSLTVG